MSLSPATPLHQTAACGEFEAAPVARADAVSTAARHALGWLVAGNTAGLYLALLLLKPEWQAGVWTYGRWMPVHLNLQLYGWTSLPLIGWLFALFEIDRTRHAAWGRAAVWAWSAALAVGTLHWLGGITSGKIFLDWKGGSLWALMAAQGVLWLSLAAAWQARRRAWSRARAGGLLLALLALALVPAALVFASSPAVYPPIDRSTGGPTGSSLLGSTLVVIGLMLLLPRMAFPGIRTSRSAGVWSYFALSCGVFGVTEAAGGTHRDPWQILPMLLLLPWCWLIPRDWGRFDWPGGSAVWRRAMLGWWAVLVVSGVVMFQDGVLDRLKFTQGLVAHTHLAMAGFTTSFCALLGVLVTRRSFGGTASVVCWHVAAGVMIVGLAASGWREGGDFRWMAAAPDWRLAGFALRAACGALMWGVSVHWFRNSGRS